MCRFFQHRSVLRDLQSCWMYYGDQICCEKWIISSVKSCFNYAEITYDSSIFSLCRLRGSHGGPWDYHYFLHGPKVGSTGGGSRNFPAENAAAASTARFDCVFACGKSHNLVARGGIGRGRRVHRHGDFQSPALPRH